MHLMDILKSRPVPAAAVSLGITRRCPLTCAHCSTNSTLASDEAQASRLLRFVHSMTAEDHPDWLLMSGGEALLRPQLVRQIAEHAHGVGARAHVLSGLFFALSPRIPKPVRAAIDAVDHFSASTDAFHEREVPRARVFRVLRELLDEGKHLSLQLVGLGPDDPYLADLVADVRRTFDDQIPMFVAPVVPHGRAGSWAERPATPHDPARPMPLPCSVAGWPVVGFDGRVTACGNQDVMDGKVPMPEHLLLGDIAVDDWVTIKERCLASPMVRALRTVGPLHVADRLRSGAVCSGYCQTCWKLSANPRLPASVRRISRQPGAIAFEAVVGRLVADAGPVAFARQTGIAEYADLIALGYPSEERAACPA